MIPLQLSYGVRLIKRTSMRLGLTIGLLLAIAALVVKLVAAPLNAVYDAQDCQQAYARSRTIRDSARVDLHPYAASGTRGRHTCGEVRARRAVTPSDISVRQPNEEL